MHLRTIKSRPWQTCWFKPHKYVTSCLWESKNFTYWPFKSSSRASDAQPARLGFRQNRYKQHWGWRKTEKREQKRWIHWWMMMMMWWTWCCTSGKHCDFVWAPSIGGRAGRGESSCSPALCRLRTRSDPRCCSGDGSLGTTVSDNTLFHSQSPIAFSCDQTLAGSSLKPSWISRALSGPDAQVGWMSPLLLILNSCFLLQWRWQYFCFFQQQSPKNQKSKQPEMSCNNNYGRRSVIKWTWTVYILFSFQIFIQTIYRTNDDCSSAVKPPAHGELWPHRWNLLSEQVLTRRIHRVWEAAEQSETFLSKVFVTLLGGPNNRLPVNKLLFSLVLELLDQFSNLNLEIKPARDLTAKQIVLFLRDVDLIFLSEYDLLLNITK